LSKIGRADVVAAIGVRQRWHFERTGEPNRGSTVDELMSDLNVSAQTVRKHLSDARRFWTIRERTRVHRSTDGRAISGRPSTEYSLEDGHRWAGLGQPLALVSAGGCGEARATAPAVQAVPADSDLESARRRIRAQRESYVSAMTDEKWHEVCSRHRAVRSGS
jgi:predicted ArsR family transcriptional regulator